MLPVVWESCKQELEGLQQPRGIYTERGALLLADAATVRAL